MNDFDGFERRLAAALRSDADASVAPFDAGSIADAAMGDIQTGARRLPRALTRPARRYGRGRGITLLAAAALLLVGGALAAGSGFVRLPSIVRPVPAPTFGLIATASPEMPSPSPSGTAEPTASPIPAAGLGGAWIATGTMGTPRTATAAVRLLDGRVLVVGGSGDETDPATAELYDPASGTWSDTATMLKPLAGFPPTLLLDGKVLVGDVGDPDPATEDDEIASAEVYDPASGTWTSAGNACFGDTATLLRDGNVLVVCQVKLIDGYTADSDAQVYHPDSGTWSAAGKMITPRRYSTATLLRDGKVLVAGGYGGGDAPVDAAELYDPDSGSWTAIANMQSDGRICTGCPGGLGRATLLPDGTVLFMRYSTVTPFAQSYDPATGAWSTIAETAGPEVYLGEPSSTALLSDGNLLVAGLLSRQADSPPTLCTTALYDPRVGSWSTASSMLRCRHGSSLTRLLDGTVLVAGGSECNESDECVATGAAELYVPAGVSPPPLPAFPSPPSPVFPSPTPVPPQLTPAVGPVPPNARSWKVTVDNRSSEPVTLFVAEANQHELRLVGSATPNVVPAGATVKVTFLFPANGGPDDGYIFVNPRLGDEGWLVGAADIGIPGKILITAEGVVGWLSP